MIRYLGYLTTTKYIVFYRRPLDISVIKSLGSLVYPLCNIKKKFKIYGITEQFLCEYLL